MNTSHKGAWNRYAIILTPYTPNGNTQNVYSSTTDLIWQGLRTYKRGGLPSPSPEQQTFLVRVVYVACCRSASNVPFYRVCFVFVFLLSSFFIEATALRSIVLRYLCAPAATCSKLTTVYGLFCFVYFGFMGGVTFSAIEYFVSLPFPLSMESTSYVFSFWMVFFLPYDHGVDF